MGKNIFLLKIPEIGKSISGRQNLEKKECPKCGRLKSRRGNYFG